jgi:hypothetical protein
MVRPAPNPAWLRPVAATATCFALILAAQGLAALVPAGWRGNWPPNIVAGQAHFIDRFFPFDAVWYWRAAFEGYRWDAQQPLVMQDIAFFPLWPMLLRLIALIVPSTAGIMRAAVVCAAAFALGSVLCFDRLARRLLPAQASCHATWLFALTPAAGFLLLSYPTGLMNLLCLACLLALLDGRLTLAASYSGLMTAAGPLGLGTGLAVCLCAARRSIAGLRTGAGWRHLLWQAAGLAGHCLLALSGLIAFLLWQAVQLGDGLASLHAQQAWETAGPWPQRLGTAALQLLVVPDLVAAVTDLKHVAHPPSAVWLELALERSLNSLAEGLGIAAVALSARFAPLPVVAQGGFTMLLFVWFEGSVRPGHATLRLTFCIMATFLGAAWLLRDRPNLARATIGLSGLLLAGGAFLIAAGYHMT